MYNLITAQKVVMQLLNNDLQIILPLRGHRLRQWLCAILFHEGSGSRFFRALALDQKLIHLDARHERLPPGNINMRIPCQKRITIPPVFAF